MMKTILAAAAALIITVAQAGPLDNAGVQIEANGTITMSKAVSEYMTASSRVFQYSSYSNWRRNNGELPICGAMPQELQDKIFDIDSETDKWARKYGGEIHMSINIERGRVRQNLRILLNEENRYACDILNSDLSVLGLRNDWVDKDEDAAAVSEEQKRDLILIAALLNNDCNWDDEVERTVVIYSAIFNHDRKSVYERHDAIMNKYRANPTATEILLDATEKGYEYGLESPDEHCPVIEEFAEQFN